MGKMMNMLWLSVLVLALASSASADDPYRSNSSSSYVDIPNGGQTTKYLDISGAPANSYVTKVEYYVRIDDKGDASNFWCSDYEIYIGNQTRGAYYARVWNNYGGKTDDGSDDDSANDSDIYLNYRSLNTTFDGDAVNQRWYVGLKDTVSYHPLFWTGQGRLEGCGFRIYYRVKKPDLYDYGESYRSFSPTTVTGGDSFSVNCRVRNGGDLSAGSFVVSFYLSTNTAISTGDWHLGDKTVSGLSAGGSTSVHYSRSFPNSSPPAGTYYVGWIIDRYGAVSESNESNNTAYKQGYRLRVVRDVTVPNVVGMSRSSAESAIATAGLSVGSVWLTYSESVPEGQVISQDPTAGTVVSPGSDVELTVSLGIIESDVEVPDVVGKSEAEAAAALAGVGLNVGTKSEAESATVPDGHVISQDPAAGSKVAQGSTVDLVICKKGEGLPGTIAHWKLDEREGPIAYDSAGPNNGILYGNPTWLPTGGVIGGALQFDGIDDYVDCQNDPLFNLTDEITLTAWVQVGLFDEPEQAIVTKGDTAWRLQRAAATNTIEFACDGVSVTGRPSSNVVGQVNVNDEQWHHLAAVYDGTTMSLYVDGVLDVSAPASGTMATNTFRVYLGENAQRTGRQWNGLMDDVRIYNLALTENQIKLVMAGGGGLGPRPEDMVAHWPFDETDGRIAYDSVGTYDGVLMGGPAWQPTGGKVNGALRFDGTNDCVVTDSVLNPADGPFDAYAWIKGGGPGEVILSQDGSAGGADWLAADATGGQLMTGLAGSGRFDQTLTSAMVITDGEWHEVGLSWDGSSRTLYVDGVTVATDALTGLVGSTGGLNIGVGKDLDAGTHFTGLIDEVRIYSRTAAR